MCKLLLANYGLHTKNKALFRVTFLLLIDRQLLTPKGVGFGLSLHKSLFLEAMANELRRS